MTQDKERVKDNWSYARTNSKGEKIFKRYTDEVLKDATTFLDKKGIDYDVKIDASMLWIYLNNKKYAYYYTTGRWNTYKADGYPTKHYHSRGIEDFYNRFLSKD